MNSRVEFRIFTIVDLDKEEEYLHEMHLKGWRYRTSCFGLFYFEQGQPDDVIYRIYDSRFLKKYKHELQDFRDRGWELIGAPQLFTPNLKTIQNPCLSLDPGWFLFSPNGCFLLDKKEFPLYGISVEKNTKRKETHMNSLPNHHFQNKSFLKQV
ncbi:IS1380-Spn1 transposase [Streptococcus pneumoniae]|nr:IS1380-Spn1 transposase [Streptococcus pneumoniae]